MGKSHPSHPFTAPHATVYETSQATPKKLPTNEISTNGKINVCKLKGLIVHSVVLEHSCGILKVPRGFPKVPMKFPGGLTMFHYVLNQGNLEEALIVNIFGLYITNNNCHDPTKFRVVNMAN